MEGKKYTEEWSSKVESETLSKTLGANLIPTKTETRATDDKRGEKPQCSCFNFEEIKVNCLQTRCAASPTNKEIKTRNLKTALPSLNSPFSRDLNSNVVYKLSFCVCNSMLDTMFDIRPQGLRNTRKRTRLLAFT